MKHGQINTKNVHLLSDTNNDCNIYCINQTIGNNENAPEKPKIVWSPQVYNQVIRFPWYKSGFVQVEEKDWIFKLVEPFITYVPSTTNPNGTLGLRSSTTGTSAAVTLPSTNRIGVVQLETGTTATGRTCIYSPNSSCRFDSGQFHLEINASIPTLPNGTESFEVFLGFGDTTNGNAPNDGAYFYASQASPNWELRSRIAGVAGQSVITNVPVNTSYNKFLILIEQAPLRASFFINDSFVGEVSSSGLPSGAGRDTGIQLSIGKSLGTLTRTLLVDNILFGAYT